MLLYMQWVWPDPAAVVPSLRTLKQAGIDRRVAQDEVVRVTLHGEDGAVLFEGEVR